MAALAGLALLVSCQHDFESPYLPGSTGYAGDDWTRDANGNGVADSLEKYSPGCKLPPKQCLDNAKIIKGLSDQPNTLYARDMLLWVGDSSQPPGLEWTPAAGSVRGYSLASSDTTKVRIKNGRLVAAALGSAQITVNVPGADSLATSFIAQVASGGQKVVSVSAEDLTILVGRDTTPNVAWTPADALYRDYSLTSDNPDVARINGESIRGVFPGKATITLETFDGGHKTAFYANVQNGPTIYYTDSVTVEDMYLVKGGSPVAPTMLWSPEGVTGKVFKLLSGDTGVAAIVNQTLVVPKAAGTTHVTVNVLDGSGKTADFTVFVAAQAVPVTGIAAAPLSLIAGGDPVRPKLTWLPSGATNRAYSLVSGDSTVASLTQNGLIRPIAMGAADFTVTTQDGGYQGIFTVTVGRPDSTNHVDSVSVAPIFIPLGTDKKPVIAWYPEYAGNQTYSLYSRDTTVAIPLGELIHPVKTGSSAFRLTTIDGSRTADFTVTVFQPVYLVTAVSADTMYMVQGEVTAPVLKWTPPDATNLKDSLVSLDTAYASIANGTLVRARNPGKARIEIHSYDGPVSTFVVIITAAPVKVTAVNMPAFVMNLGDIKDPPVTVSPPTATNKALTFKTAAGNNVISVSSQNKIIANAVGKAQLTAVSDENANITAVCSVTVVAMVKSVSAKDDTLRLGGPDKDVSPGLTWNPPNATDKNFALTTKDTNLVKIDGKSYRGVGGGTAKVVVRALDGSNQSDTFNVWVKIPVTGIAAKDYTMKTTDTALFRPNNIVSLAPANASDKTWYLTYTNPNATPAPSGIVKIVAGWQLQQLAIGTVSMTVISNDNNALKDTFALTVIQPVTGISAAAIAVKTTDPDKDAAVTVSPANAFDKGYTLSSGNTAIATVAANKIHAVSGGTATFTATSTGDASKSVNFNVTVTVPVASISAADLAMKVGDAIRDPVITWAPSNASNKGYTLATSNASILQITNNRLQAAGPGNATVTITTADGSKTGTFTVAVTQPVAGISAAVMGIRRPDGDRDPVLTWSPGNASNKGYTLTGGTAGIATVVSNRIHPVGSGTANFTATTNDGGFTATFPVSVTVPVTGLQANDMTFKITDPDQAPVLTWTPSDATNKGYSLISSDEGIVSVTANGLLHAASRGSTVVYVYSAESDQVSGSFNVTIKNQYGF